jgi:hypothetical protein
MRTTAIAMLVYLLLKRLRCPLKMPASFIECLLCYRPDVICEH